MLILLIVIFLTLPYAWYLPRVLFTADNILNQLEIFKWLAVGVVLFTIFVSHIKILINIMSDYIPIEIYKDNNPLGARTIWIKLLEGKLYMSEQDVSPQLEQIFGRDTYERFISKIPVNDVKQVLGVDADSQLIEILKHKFGKNSGIDDFRAFLESNEIHYEYGSY